MKQLFEYLIDRQYDALVIEEEANIIAEEQINESFKSSIVQKLAQAIYDAEKERNKRKVEIAKADDEKYPQYGPHNPNVTNFASIFGPKTEGGKYNTKKGLQGLKWSEITDDDFKVYDPNDKELIKLIKRTYGKKDGNADFIVVDNKDNVINFIKAYGKDPKADGMFYFKAAEINKYGSKIDSEVRELTQPYYSYQSRPLKTKEVIDLLHAISQIYNGGAKVYALEVTDEMIKDYKNLQVSREEAKKGVINFDKKSLETLLRNQQARYKTMVAEIKAKKLQKDPNVLFNEIKEANDKVVALYKKVMANPNYLDQYYDLGRLMSYVSYAYESLYKSMKKSREADKEEAYALKDGDTPEQAKRWRRHKDEDAQNEINDAKEYVEKVKKMIAEIEEKLK